MGEKKEKAVQIYRKALRDYFADKTDEGALAKRYYFKGIESLIIELFGDEVDVKGIYEEEYWASQRKSKS